MYNSERNKELISEYQNFFPLNSLQEKYNISRQRIYQILDRNQIQRRTKRHK